MEKKETLISKFFKETPVGICTDNIFEFGNLYRKNFQCSFYKEGKCHYKGECDRRDVPDKNLGWRIS